MTKRGYSRHYHIVKNPIFVKGCSVSVALKITLKN